MKKNSKNKRVQQKGCNTPKVCRQTEPVYLKLLREMDGAKKLRISFELYEIALNLCKQNIREQNPEIPEEELKKHLWRRMGYDSGRSTTPRYFQD